MCVGYEPKYQALYSTYADAPDKAIPMGQWVEPGSLWDDSMCFTIAITYTDNSQGGWPLAPFGSSDCVIARSAFGNPWYADHYGNGVVDFMHEFAGKF